MIDCGRQGYLEQPVAALKCTDDKHGLSADYHLSNARRNGELPLIR